jgi:PAS domain S-box-containing protein
VQNVYGHLVHYGVEVTFYSLAGPMVTWLTLVWVERRLAEKEALEKQVFARERHLASLTAASADAILSLDGNGRITSWNRGAKRLFGYAAGDIMGQPLTILLPEAARLSERLQRDDVVQNFETTALAHDGRSISVELTQTLLADDVAETPASSLIIRDVTARRERAAIIEEERARIARDLHDGVAQTLYLLALKADMAARQVTRDPDQVTADLKEIGRRARRVIREVRRTIFALHPLDWSEKGFLPALRRFVRDFAEQAGWRASFSTGDEELDVPIRLEPTLFRLVQESLNNVAKHAEAGRVWVEIHRSGPPAQLVLTVRDDGRGFDPGATNSNGLGLSQMRQRVRAAGGSFKLDSSPGSGSVITAQLPL